MHFYWTLHKHTLSGLYNEKKRYENYANEMKTKIKRCNLKRINYEKCVKPLSHHDCLTGKRRSYHCFRQRFSTLLATSEITSPIRTVQHFCECV